MSQPDIIALLSSESTNSSSNDNTGNDNNCQQSSSNNIGNVTWERYHNTIILSIANSTRVNGGSWQLVQIASLLSSRAQSIVAGSKESLDARNGQAIEWWESATSRAVAHIGSARVVILTSDVGVRASNSGITTVIGASVEVIALNRNIQRRIVASSDSITEIKSAGVTVRASLSNVFA